MSHFSKKSMPKIIDVKLTSIFSPVCQTLINENSKQQETKSIDESLANCTELLIIRLDGSVIAFGTFEVINEIRVHIKSLHFRNIVKDHSFAEFWLSRYLKRFLRKTSYLHFMLSASTF
jgi:hypothetical protein